MMLALVKRRTRWRSACGRAVPTAIGGIFTSRRSLIGERARCSAR